MKGRKPTPHTLRVLFGNPQHRPMGEGDKVPRAMPPCPKELSDAAKRRWKKLAPLLYDVGLLTLLDGDLLALYCQVWAECQELTKTLGLATDKPARVLVHEGKFYANPLVAQLNTAKRLLYSLAAELGLSVISRTRLDMAASTTGEADEVRSRKRG